MQLRKRKAFDPETFAEPLDTPSLAQVVKFRQAAAI